MNEIKYVDIADCKSQGNFLKAVCFKPKKAPLICLILGVLLMIPNNIYVRLLGVFFIFMSFLVIKLVRDFKVMDIFDKGIMFYINLCNAYNESLGSAAKYDASQYEVKAGNTYSGVISGYRSVKAK